ncbi:hypothetical protein [Melghirimyces algeriensis]|uniref:Uncharacterized protein n=1 Tax=Melghirimyces algeriensis TaxID=910412 RepID=A0A521FA00_9BACL|nr:hypothetical protein [Melghirimyces algeriensis]SMO93052.1 hypothetical protein SAMN06264849_11527 [Melghirimyces algeriensis]
MNEKQIDIVIEETKEEVANILNESKLPVSILGLIMREMAQQITAQERQIVDQLKQNNEHENEVKAK